MTTKQSTPSTEMATVPTTALSTAQSSTELATMPDDLMQHAGAGTESIGTDDVKPPRIRLCQSGTPQRKPDDPQQIKGLNELDIFNDVSGEIYGRKVRFTVIKALGHRHIEFAPMDDGGGVIDFDVKDGDPRTQFTTDAQGERVKPIATKFYDYLVWLPDHFDVGVLSFKSTSLKAAIKLNGFLKMPLKINGVVLASPPAWARTFELTTTMDRKDSFAWGVYNIGQPMLTDTDVRTVCADLFDTYKAKTIKIDADENDNSDAIDVDAQPIEDM